MTSMKNLWAVMKSMYPHSFKEYGPVDGPVYRFWCRSLDGLSVDAGIAALECRTSAFPPSLPEFKTMCGALEQLPQNDEDMRQWAVANGYGDARPTESWQQYRARIEAQINRGTAPQLTEVKRLA